MKVLDDLKKIISFTGTRLKSTFQMLSYLKKMKTSYSPKIPQPEENVDQGDTPSKEKKTKSKKEKVTPPALETSSSSIEQATTTPKKKGKKESLPPLNILTDEEPPKKKSSWLAWIGRINLSNPYIATLGIIILLGIAIFAFWIALERLFPTPSSQPHLNSEPKTDSNSPSENKKNDQTSLQQQNLSVTPEILHSDEKEKRQKPTQQENSETPIQATPPSPPQEVVSTTETTPPLSGNHKEQSHEEVSVVYQPLLDLEKTKGLFRTINPHFFMETPPLDAQGNPTNLPPRIAIIVYNVGINDLDTDSLLSELPEEVTLSMSPYGSEGSALIEEAKSLGYSVLVQMPWDDGDPYTDQGYLTVITDSSQEKTMEVLNKYKPLVNTADGFFAEGGGKLVRHPEKLTLVLKFIAATKNCLVAPKDVLMTSLHEKAAETKVNYVSTTIINPDFDTTAALEKLTKRTGFAILAFPTGPKIIPRINDWINRLEKLGIDIVPITKIIVAK